MPKSILDKPFFQNEIAAYAKLVLAAAKIRA